MVYTLEEVADILFQPPSLVGQRCNRLVMPWASITAIPLLSKSVYLTCFNPYRQAPDDAIFYTALERLSRWCFNPHYSDVR